MAFEPGRRLAHYRIERRIGEGGMGVVFLAEDTTLHRKVALKVLPPETAADASRLERFRREAQAVAALNHPHIVTLYSVEEDDGTHFLTMELVDGESLDRCIPPGGLPRERVLEIGLALADALSAAHERGIVHRDLKPANVMLTRDGRVKVLDFGLAKLAPALPEGTTAETMTRNATATAAGLLLGTVPYMSPEQVRGEAVDGRSDIFSLGIVLYELATGRRPFERNSPAETMSAILRDAPRPLSDARLARIVGRCLQKEARDRFQTARDVYNELREPEAVMRGRKRLWIGAAAILVLGAATAGIFLKAGSRAPESGPPVVGDSKSIAVLPFVNMSSDAEQEYFSDGISEELLNLLAKVPELRVAARTSSFSFKGKQIEVPEIARKLHVTHVLEGSVRKSGGRVRITAQLIQASDGFHVWSRTFDRRLDDIFALQDEIAAEVVKELKGALLGGAPRSRTTDPEAYALFLQALQLERQYTEEAFVKVEALLRRVLELDPRYPPAWTLLSVNFLDRVTIGMMTLSTEDACARAREAAMKALEIDPEFAPPHMVLSTIASRCDADLVASTRHQERALALDPSNLDGLGTAATLLLQLGRGDEALALRREILRRDPLNVNYYYDLAAVQYQSGRFDEAIATLRMGLDLSPGVGVAHYLIGMCSVLKGDAATGLDEIQRETGEAWRAIGLPIAYHALRRKDDSDAALAALLTKPEQDFSYNFATVYAFRGETDRAFEYLEKAARYRDIGLIELLEEPLLASLRNDPRWLPFLRKIGRAPEQLAKIRFEVPPLR